MGDILPNTKIGNSYFVHGPIVSLIASGIAAFLYTNGQHFYSKEESGYRIILMYGVVLVVQIRRGHRGQEVTQHYNIEL